MQKYSQIRNLKVLLRISAEKFAIGPPDFQSWRDLRKDFKLNISHDAFILMHVRKPSKHLRKHTFFFFLSAIKVLAVVCCSALRDGRQNYLFQKKICYGSHTTALTLRTQMCELCMHNNTILFIPKGN